MRYNKAGVKALGKVRAVIDSFGLPLIKVRKFIDWCQKVSKQVGSDWRYVRVGQTVFGTGKFGAFEELLGTIRNQEAPPII